MSKNTSIGLQGDEVLSKTITINLVSTERDLVSIGTEWVVKVDVPQNRLLNFFKSKKSIDANVRVGIENLVVPPALSIDPNMPLLELVRKAERHQLTMGTQLTGSFDMRLTSELEIFSLFFNPKAVVDVTEKQQPAPKMYTISFFVVLTDTNNVAISRRKVELTLKFDHVITRPRVRARFSKDLKYNPSTTIERVGKISVANDQRLTYAPRIDVDVDVDFGTDAQGANVAKWLWLDYEHASIPVQQIDGHRFRILGLEKDRELVIPVLADIHAIGNPVKRAEGKTELTMTPKVTYWNENEPAKVESLHIDTVSFAVTKNTEQPVMQVKVTDPGNPEKPTTDVSPAVTGRDRATIVTGTMSYLPQAGLEFPIVIDIENLATDNTSGGGIEIKQPTVQVKLQRNNDVTVVFANKVTDNEQNLFTLEGGAPTTIHNGKGGEKVRWRLVFHSSRLADIYASRNGQRVEEPVKIEARVSFDYFESANIDYAKGETKHLELIFMIPLYRQPNPDWLAIDFGTSAIVSKYSNTLLDLHKQKNKLDNGEDDYEIGTPFLSSNIVLRPVGVDRLGERSQLRSQHNLQPDFDILAVHLSPTSTSERANIQYVVPCLKLIVGYELLPNVDYYDRANFIYSYIDPDENKLVREKLQVDATDAFGSPVKLPTPLAHVDTIFGEVYSEMFEYYLAPLIKESAGSINQLVLTIPNTYSPLHLQRIRQIVHSALHDIINVRTIRFVSESDAVACYYQYNWMDINRRLGRESNIGLRTNENVLVYDMGAGTLDVTLFRRESDDKGHVTIRVLGKIGIAKAGNYLDSLIAKVLTKHFPQMVNFSDPEQITSADRITSAIRLKNFIKNEIKPRLSGESLKYTFTEQREIGIRKRDSREVMKDPTLAGESLANQDLGELILEQPEFKKYIHEVTSDFLDNFFRFFDKTDTKIATVIMSGRSAKLKPLQAALQQALSAYAAPNMQIVDVSELTEKGSQFDKAKTIVVEGAEIYARHYSNPSSAVQFVSPNLVASYGVIYRDVYGEVHYAELLNPRTATPTGTVTADGSKIHTYLSDEVKLDLSSTTTLQLVQTFAADTKRDWEEKRHEYITVMREIDITGYAGRNEMRLRLEVDGLNQMSFLINGMESRGIPSSKIDISSESNQRSLWPVLK